MKVPSPPAELRHLAAELAEAKPMRRGSLSERMVKCSKPGCPCADNPEARHGPYFSLTRAVQGKTHSRFLTPEQAALARQQIAAGHQFRARIEALWKGCEAWADSHSCRVPLRPPSGRPKKRAHHGDREGNHPGNRDPRRF